MDRFHICDQTLGILKERLKHYGYTEQTLCARLDIQSIYEIPFNFIPFFQISQLKNKNEPVDILFLVFFFEEKVSQQDLLNLFSNEEIKLLVENSILTDLGDALYKSAVAIHPYQDHCFFTDLNYTPGVTHEMDAACYAISVESRYLAGHSERMETEKVLDLGTGCGIQAILAAKKSNNVVGVDLTSRAVNFATINAAFNNVENVKFKTGSVFDPVNGQKFDSIVSNPPICLPSTEEDQFYGDKVIKTILVELKDYLSQNGICQMICHMAAPEEVVIEELITEWIGDVPYRVEMEPIYYIDYYRLLQKWMNVPLAGEQWCKCPADADDEVRLFAATKWVDFLTKHRIKGQRGSLLEISWDERYSIVTKEASQEAQHFTHWR
jgi:hypothetical protein